MATTINIPLTELQAGVDLSTPWEPIGSFLSFMFALNRNVGAIPIDTLDGTVFVMYVDYSQDNGASVWESDSQTIGGGVVLAKDGVTEITVSQWGSTFPDNITSVRARVSPAQTCTVSGSLTLSP